MATKFFDQIVHRIIIIDYQESGIVESNFII